MLRILTIWRRRSGCLRHKNIFSMSRTRNRTTEHVPAPTSQRLWKWTKTRTQRRICYRKWRVSRPRMTKWQRIKMRCGFLAPDGKIGRFKLPTTRTRKCYTTSTYPFEDGALRCLSVGGLVMASQLLKFTAADQADHSKSRSPTLDNSDTSTTTERCC